MPDSYADRLAQRRMQESIELQRRMRVEAQGRREALAWIGAPVPMPYAARNGAAIARDVPLTMPVEPGATVSHGSASVLGGLAKGVAGEYGAPRASRARAKADKVAGADPEAFLPAIKRHADGPPSGGPPRRAAGALSQRPGGDTL